MGSQFGWVMLVVGSIPLNLSAARLATVERDETAVYAYPDQQSEVLEVLSQETHVAASNLPTQGFHKVRTPSEKVGWILQNQLILSDPPSQKDLDQARALVLQNLKKEEPLHSEKSFHLASLRMEGHAGVHLLPTSGLNAKAQGYGLGSLYGMSFVYALSSHLGLLFRIEHCLRTTVLKDETTQLMYQLEYSTFPTMLGWEWSWMPQSRVTLQMKLLGGLAFLTRLHSIQLDSASSSAGSKVLSRPWTAALMLDLSWRVSRLFSLFFETGFRSLQTPSLTPSAGEGQNILNSSLKLNLSGFWGAFGVGVHF